MTDPSPVVEERGPAGRGSAGRGEIWRGAIGIGIYAGLFGMTFGAVSAAAGFALWQTMILSLVMFSGASQFAFVGVIAAGGAPATALGASVLLAVRNAFYGVSMTSVLPRSLWRRAAVAHLVIDESTAMGLAQSRPADRRFAFVLTGLAVLVWWNLGTLLGALVGAVIDTRSLGLDAAAPAAFLALLWGSLTTAKARIVAIGGALVAVGLIPIALAGVPVLAAAVVALAAGVTVRGEPVVAAGTAR